MNVVDDFDQDQFAVISEHLASHHSPETLQNIVNRLGFRGNEILEKRLFTSVTSLLHQLIFEWHHKSPSNSVELFAQILYSCGCYQEAIRLHPPCKYPIYMYFSYCISQIHVIMPKYMASKFKRMRFMSSYSFYLRLLDRYIVYDCGLCSLQETILIFVLLSSLAILEHFLLVRMH